MRYSVRRAEPDDAEFLWVALYHASYAADAGMPEPEALGDSDELGRYVDGWGDARGDLGVVAVDDEAGDRVGAAWLRLLTGESKGYGYVDDDTPELAVAVVPGHRGRGLGERMLRELLDAGQGDFDAVSLSVRTDNPARHLYERLGFRAVAPPDPTGGSITMVRALGDM